MKKCDYICKIANIGCGSAKHLSKLNDFALTCHYLCKIAN